MSIAPCDSTQTWGERQKPSARNVLGADNIAAQHFCGFREYQGIYGLFEGKPRTDFSNKLL
jgi:hypothetical protein